MKVKYLLELFRGNEQATYFYCTTRESAEKKAKAIMRRRTDIDRYEIRVKYL